MVRAAWMGLLLVVLVGLSTVATVASRSAGAPADAAEKGCSCHRAVATPSVVLSLAGLDETYEGGRTYNLTFSFVGPASLPPPARMAQGGLAVRVTKGTFLVGPGTQVLENGAFLTQVKAGTQQRSWTFQWVAPAEGNDTVIFYYAGNAVNGDGTEAGDLDSWNKGSATVIHARPNATTASDGRDPGDGSTPFVGGFATVSGLLAAAWVARRR